jgi:hypothetical protein
MTFGRLRLTPPQLALAVATALVLAANLYFGVGYVDARQQRWSLNDQFHKLVSSLQRLVAGQGETASPDGEVVGALAFPPSLPGVELTDLVIRSARDSGVEVLSLRSVAVPNEAIGTGTYRAVRVDVRLRADRGRLARFFDDVERGGLQSLVVDNLTVTSDGERDELVTQILAYATTDPEAK